MTLPSDFATSVQEKVSLFRRVDDRASVEIANSACSNLVMGDDGGYIIT
jgi:hypothetical protein